jgi:hypothetical protein
MDVGGGRDCPDLSAGGWELGGDSGAVDGSAMAGPAGASGRRGGLAGGVAAAAGTC